MLKKLVSSGIVGGGTVLAGGSLATHNYVSNSPQPDSRWDNNFYKNVFTQLFKLDGTPVEQKFFESTGECNFCSTAPYNNPLYLRVIWERSASVDWFGASRYESWYKINGWSYFAAKDSYLVFWNLLEGHGHMPVTEKCSDIPDVIKSKTLTDELLVKYF